MHQLTSHHDTRSVSISFSQLHFPPPFPHRALGCSQRLLPRAMGTVVSPGMLSPHRGTGPMCGSGDGGKEQAAVRLEQPPSCPAPSPRHRHSTPAPFLPHRFPRGCSSPGLIPTPQKAHTAPTPPSPAPAMPRRCLVLALGPPRAPRIAETPRR